MQVYFSGTIMGDRSHVATFRRIVEHIQARGHTVPTAHVARENVLQEEIAHAPEQVYERDVTWLRGSDCLVAEVSTPSLGVGYEVCYALVQVKPVLCLYRRGRPLSKMILGCAEPGITVRDYADEAEALALVDEFLAQTSDSPQSTQRTQR